MKKLLESNKTADGRAEYQRPGLREFGHIGVLTQAGSGQMAEGNGPNMNDPARKP